MTNNEAAMRAIFACESITNSVAKLSKIASKKLGDESPCPYDVEPVIGELERIAKLLGMEKQ